MNIDQHSTSDGPSIAEGTGEPGIEREQREQREHAHHLELCGDIKELQLLSANWSDEYIWELVVGYGRSAGGTDKVELSNVYARINLKKPPLRMH